MTTCCCLYINRHLRVLDHQETYDDGTIWNVFQPCPEDGNVAAEVADSPILRRHLEDHEETAVVQTAA